MIWLRRILAGIAATIMAGTAPLQAQSGYPERPVKIIVPIGPGGSYDLVGRYLADALSKRLGSKLIHFVPRANIVQHAELRRQTVIEYAPDSAQADEYRQLANKIHNNSGNGVIPTPITMEELEDMLMDFGIMKTEEQALAELQEKEAAAAAKAAASA